MAKTAFRNSQNNWASTYARSFLLINLIIFLILGILFLFFSYKSEIREIVSRNNPNYFNQEIRYSSWEETSKLEQDLERERIRRGKIKEIIERYQEEFGNNFAIVLSRDIERYKQKVGVEEFRRRFGDELKEYELKKYPQDDLFEEDNLSENIEESYWRIGSGGIFK